MQQHFCNIGTISITLHRSLFPGDALEVEVQAPRKMTPKKKKLATKVKKTPEKKGATKKK